MLQDTQTSQLLIGQNGSDNSNSLGGLNEHLLKQFVRLALFADLNKLPLKREEFIRKVLKERSREFHAYLNGANSILKDMFGIELVEVPAKDSSESHPLSVESNDTLQYTQSHKIRHSHTYILRSILHSPTMREVMCRKEDYAEKGLLLLILSLLLIHHQTLTEEELFLFLKKFHIERGGVHHQLGDIDKLYSKFVKEHYLNRCKILSNQEFDTYQVVWGYRSHLEVKMTHIADAIFEIMELEKTPLSIKQLERASGLEGVFEDGSESTAEIQETL